MQLSHNHDLNSKQNDKQFNSFPSVWYKCVFLFARETLHVFTTIVMYNCTLDVNVFKQSFNNIESA